MRSTIKLNPAYALAYANRGYAYHFIDDIDKAIADYSESIFLDPENAQVYEDRGNAYSEKGNFEKAIADYTQMLVLKPKVAESYYIRGEVYLRAKKWEDGKRDLTAAILQAVDISAQFLSTHESIPAFEEKFGVQLPEDIVNLLTSNSETFEIDRDERIALAMKYYERRELSSGLASRLADVPRGKFIFLMGDYGLSPFGTAEELRESGF